MTVNALLASMAYWIEVRLTEPPDPPPPAPEEIAAVLDWMLVACALFVDKLPLARALREVRAFDVAV